MKYACLVYPDREGVLSLPESEFNEIMDSSITYVENLEKSGRHLFSSPLESAGSAATLRRRNGRLVVTDGPYLETKEFLGGITILEARDINEAIQMASQLAILNCTSIEVRPLIDPNQTYRDPFDDKVASASRFHLKAN